ncbi:MAG: SCO family protein [Deltaproteobacteria bacterium]|nr:SCO family protein [Deltaproteobacteria bacterium]
MTELKALVIGLSLATAALLALQRPAFGHDHKGTPLEKATPRREIRLPIGDFSLKDQAGKPFSFQSLRGKVVLVGFIYTTCPDICPLITVNMQKVLEGLTRRGEREGVFFLSITTDPEIDAPEVLKSYGKRYKIDFSEWALITGDTDSLKRVWKAFGVRVERKARGLIDHTALTALVDRKGVMRHCVLRHCSQSEDDPR